MKLETDTLKCAKILKNKGISTTMAEALVETATTIDITNLYSKYEVDDIMNKNTQALLNTLDDFRHEMNHKFDTLRTDIHHTLDMRLQKTADDFRAQLRWTVTTMIGAGAVFTSLLASMHFFFH